MAAGGRDKRGRGRAGHDLPQCQHALLAAAAGQSVALAAGDLAEGRLVRLFAPSLPAPFAYYVVCPEAYAKRPKIRAFHEWLLAEAGAPTKSE